MKNVKGVRENTKIQLYYLGGGSHSSEFINPKGCEITYPELGKYLPQLRLPHEAVPSGVPLTFARHVCVPVLKDDWEGVAVAVDVQALGRQRGHPGEIIRIADLCRDLGVALDPGSKVQVKWRVL